MEVQQSAEPVRGLGVWYPMWVALAVVAAGDTARPVVKAQRSAGAWRSRTAAPARSPRCSASPHVANHLAGLWGGERHVAVMTALRTVYRMPAVEAVLLLAVTFQVLSGLSLLRRHDRRDGSWWETAQQASGAYLAGFFLSHLTAALRARSLRGVDTNWLWLTADSMLSDPWSARLAPYYALGVVAFGMHAGLGLRYVMRARGWSPASADRIGVVVPGSAAIASVLIMTALLWP